MRGDKYMGIFRIVEAFPGDLNKNSNYRGFRISEVRIGEVLLYLEEEGLYYTFLSKSYIFHIFDFFPNF